MISYIGLFTSALVAATILPMQSEAVLVGLLVVADHPASVLIVVVTLGNVLGAVINWYRRYGRWSLLGSWLPVVGDPLTLMAGFMREPLIPFLLLVTIAKGTRYLLLAAATLTWL